MRRLLPVVLATLLATLLLVPTTAAMAAPQAQPVVVLAAEGGEGPVGPEPRGPDDSENTHAPADYQPNFLINAAVGLTALLILLVIGLGGMYWLLVQRPRTSSQT